MSSSCELNWYSDRGFELDLESAGDEISIRLVGVPVPADGLVELHAGPVALYSLDILFKAQVDIEEDPGQFQDAFVQLATEGATSTLTLTGNIEDVETAEILPYKIEVPVAVPSGAPQAGGPRPSATLEDDLDWEDETTLEQMVVNAPESTPAAAPPNRVVQEEPGRGGLEALLKALANFEDVDDGGGPVTDEAPLPTPTPVVVEEPEPEPEPEGDQTFSADEEARGLLQLMIARDALELEEDFDVSALVHGVMPILAMPVPPLKMAEILSGWLLEQDAVADLYVGDEDLAEILEQW